MRLRDCLLALSVPMIWGMGFVFAKAALEYFPPILLMAFRFTVTALVMVWFVPRPRGLMAQIFLIALVSAALQYGFTFYGLKSLDASVAALVVQLEVPFMVLLGAIFLKDRPGARKLLGMLLAFAGVLLIAGEPQLQNDWLPLLLLVTGAFLWACGQVMIRRLGEVGGFALIAWVSVFAAPQLFFASWLVESEQLRLIAEANWVVWGTVLYLGLVMTALAYGVWYHLLGRFPISSVGPYLLLLPVFSILGGALLLGERPTAQVLIGGAVVVAGVAAIVVERRRLTPA